MWLIVAAVAALGELLTVDLWFAFVSGAALITALVAAVSAPLAVQLIVMIAVSVAGLALVRPLAKRHLRTPVQIRTGTAALIGQRAVVVDRVDGEGGTVKIGGEVWSARPLDESEVLEPGTRVNVARIDGATAVVYS